ncbi:hypothetical protein EIP91_009191 [Steccherinum ochraceum]|uniref:F-box domain-containing protein n=1 Tax=Steccherinum ochraceum TaxID=92696 RepID=A0A4R0R4L0_9APHY|nr:hypothetical protein EIP91_009191 [Steccherinum ochraceum]
MPPKKRGKRAVASSQQNPLDSQTRRAVGLPDEIVDHIFSFIGMELDDYTTPCSLSRVCRSWFAVARPYVFRSVCVRTEARAMQFSEFLDKNPIIRQWVRKLRIINPPAEFWKLWCSTAFVQMASSFPGLYAVSFEHATCGALLVQPIPNDQQVTLRKHLLEFRNVHELSFLRCRIFNNAFVPFIGWFPCIQYVFSDLDDTYWSGHPFEKLKPPLESLSVARCCLPVESFLLPGSLQSLRSLRFEMNLQRGNQSTFLFVMTCLGHSLRTLVLDIPFAAGITRWYSSALRTDWDASRLTGLCDLEVRFRPEDTVVVTVLRKLGWLSVKTLTLKISFDFISDFYGDGTLNDALALPSFQHLESLRLIYAGSLAPSIALRRLEEMLPALWDRGIEVKFEKERVKRGSAELNALLQGARSWGRG